MTYFCMLDPSISRKRFELETSNLACGVITGEANVKNEKNRSKGGRENVTCSFFFEFLNPSISPERFELETSNLVCRLSTGGPNGLTKKLQIWHEDRSPGTITTKNEKLGQSWLGGGHVTYFWNFRTSFISRERFELETSNLACRLTTGSTNDKNEKNWSNGVWKGSSYQVFGRLLIN